MSDPQKPSSSKYARELTGLIVAPFLIWLVGWSPPWAWVGAISLFSALALHEFLLLGEKKGYLVQKTLSIVLMFVIICAMVIPGVPLGIAVYLVLLAIPGSYVFARTDLDQALPSTAVSVMSTLYIGLLSGAIIRLRLDFGRVGPKLVLFLMLVVWMGDAGAYYVGKNLGKRRLLERVSPKKTVEGFAGGLAAAVACATAIHYAFFREIPLLHAMIVALVLSAAGVVGDLTESLWKRSAAVKDSGALIPGHGGFLDRLDSIFFTAPILYAYWFLFLHHFEIVP
jgi:phosphatidate cytidylyltransferase